MKYNIVSRVVKGVEKLLWQKFELMQNFSKIDLVNVIKQVDVDIVWSDCLKFLAKGDQVYVSEQSLIHMKDDTATLVNMFRLFTLHHITK